MLLLAFLLLAFQVSATDVSPKLISGYPGGSCRSDSGCISDLCIDNKCAPFLPGSRNLGNICLNDVDCYSRNCTFVGDTIWKECARFIAQPTPTTAPCPPPPTVTPTCPSCSHTELMIFALSITVGILALIIFILVILIRARLASVTAVNQYEPVPQIIK